MLDLHTHILPAMDDGSRDVEETLQLHSCEITVLFSPI